MSSVIYRHKTTFIVFNVILFTVMTYGTSNCVLLWQQRIYFAGPQLFNWMMLHFGYLNGSLLLSNSNVLCERSQNKTLHFYFLYVNLKRNINSNLVIDYFFKDFSILCYTLHNLFSVHS